MAQSSAERIARIVLQYEVNRASAQAAANSADAVSAQLTKVGIAADTVGVKAQTLQAAFANIARQSELDRIAAQMSFARSQGESLETAVIRASSELNRLGATENEIDRVARAFDRAEKEARDLANAEQGLFKGGRLQGGALGRIGSELRQLPSVQIPGAGFGTDSFANILRVAGAANTIYQQSGVALSQVALSGGIAVGAIGAVAVALDVFSKSTQTLKSGMEAAIKAQDNYYQAIQENTTAATQEQIASLQRNTDALRQQQQETRNAIGAFFVDPNENIAQTAVRLATIDGVLKAIIGSGAQVPQLQEQYNQLDAQIRENENTIARLSQGLEANAFAANDAAEAEQQLLEARIAGTRADADEAQRFATQAREFSLLTSKQANARIQQFETENEGLMAAMEAITLSYGASTDMIRDAADRFFAEGQNDIEALQSALQAAGVPDDLIGDYLDYRDALRQNLDSIDQVETAIRDVITAREIEEDTIRSTIRVLQEQAALQVQAVNLLQTGTVESIDQRTVSLLAEQDALSRTIPELEAMRDTSDEAEKAFRDATNRIIGISAELKVLGAIRPEVAQRQYREEVEKLTASLVSDIQKIEAARDNRIAQIESDLRVKEADLARDRSDALVDAERDAAEKRLAAIEDFREAEAKINRKFDRDYLNAVSNRDALAAFEAKQAREDALQDEEQKLAKQNATISKALDKQQRTIEERYDKQLRTARDAANRAIQLERDKATAEINLRTQAYTAELQGLQNRLFAEFALQNQFWAASIALAQRAVASISQQSVPQIIIPNTVQLPPTTSQQQAYNQFAAYQRSQGIPGFASGLERVPYDNFIARLHRDEMVLPARQAQIVREGRSGGGISITVPVYGTQLTRRQIKEHVLDELDDKLTKAGWN